MIISYKPSVRASVSIFLKDTCHSLGKIELVHAVRCLKIGLPSARETTRGTPFFNYLTTAGEHR